VFFIPKLTTLPPAISRIILSPTRGFNIDKSIVSVAKKFVIVNFKAYKKVYTNSTLAGGIILAFSLSLIG